MVQSPQATDRAQVRGFVAGGQVGEEDWWGDVKRETVRLVKRLLESAMEEELLGQLRAGWYWRSRLRLGYRNGYRHRDLLAELGQWNISECLGIRRDYTSPP